MSGSLPISRERSVSTETSKAPTKNNPCKIALLVGGIFIAIAGLAAAGALFPHIGYYSAAIAGGGLVIGIPLAVYAARTLKNQPASTHQNQEDPEQLHLRLRDRVAALLKDQEYIAFIRNGMHSVTIARGEGSKKSIEHILMTPDQYRNLVSENCRLSDDWFKLTLNPGEYGCTPFSLAPGEVVWCLCTKNQGGVFNSRLVTTSDLDTIDTTEFKRQGAKL